MTTIYLDWAATAPVEEEFLKIFSDTALHTFANPSSGHSEGRKAKTLLEENRKSVSDLFGVKPEEIVFTSSGTESNGIVLTSLLPRKGNIAAGGFEHSSVYEQIRYLELFGIRHSLVPGKNGFLDPGTLSRYLTEDTLLVTVMAINNETGAVQPVEEIKRALEEHYKGKRVPHFHVDAVQAAGKIPAALWAPWCDSFSISGHKLGAPRGCGVLAIKRSISPLFRGGGQERGMRPGTENLPAITAATEAISRACLELDTRRTLAGRCGEILRKELSPFRELRFLSHPDAPGPGNFSPFIVSLSLPPLPSEVSVRILSEEGFAVSAGSACSTSAGRKPGRETPGNRVLLGSGIDPIYTASAIRVSFSHHTKEEEILSFCGAVKKSLLPMAERIRGGKSL